MPLLRGGSGKTIGHNIEELEHAYEQKGRIGNTRPRNAAHARRIATAIAMDEARESGVGNRGSGTARPGRAYDIDREKAAQRSRVRRRRGRK